MNNTTSIFLIFFCLGSLFSFAQKKNYSISDNRIPVFYEDIKNPMKVLLCSSIDSLYRLKVKNGKIDTINNEIYWTPYNWSSKIYIELKTDSTWNVIDSVKSKIRFVDPEHLTLMARPTSFQHGLPNLSRFTHFEVEDDGKYAHLDLDSLVWLFSLTAIIKNNKGELIEKLFYSQSFSQPEKIVFQKRLRNIQEGETLTLLNIKLKGICWVLDGKHTIRTLPKHVCIKNWL